jgi:hypothetical protein
VPHLISWLDAGEDESHQGVELAGQEPWSPGDGGMLRPIYDEGHEDQPPGRTVRSVSV